jgi:hypothetical protein
MHELVVKSVFINNKHKRRMRMVNYPFIGNAHSSKINSKIIILKGRNSVHFKSCSTMQDALYIREGKFTKTVSTTHTSNTTVLSVLIADVTVSFAQCFR